MTQESMKSALKIDPPDRHERLPSVKETEEVGKDVWNGNDT
jgi:hypothetical protein